MSSDATFHEVRTGLLEGKVCLVDVRTAEERLLPGRIPASKHVPLSDFDKAFGKFDPDGFAKEYDFKMPAKEVATVELILFGSGGKQVQKAAEALRGYGWHSVRVYPDSLSDWKSKGGQVLSGAGKIVDYDWVREALESGRTDTLLLDVRNRPERREPGYIPGSRNVPLPEVMEAFHQLSPSEFLTRYDFGRPRPSGFVRVVTHCKSGVRAGAAADILRLLDFTDMAVYKGSMNDWANRGGPVKKE